MPNSIIKNIKQNFNSLTKQQKYGLFFAALILLGFVGLIISNLYGEESIQPEQNQTQQTTQYESINENISTQLNSISSQFVNSKDFNQNEKTERFSTTQLQSANSESVVFNYVPYQNRSYEFVLGLNEEPNFKAGVFEVTVDSEDAVISKYVNTLNSSLGSDDFSFKVKKMGQQYLAEFGFEYSEVYEKENATHLESIYYVYLNDNLFTPIKGDNSIVSIRDLGSGEAKVTFPKFLPKSIEVEGSKVFNEGEYTLKPSVPEDPYFDYYYVTHNVEFTNENLENSFDNPSIIYVYESSQNVIIPVLSKRYELEDYDDLNKEYYWLSSE